MARDRKDDVDEEIDNTFYIPSNFTDSGRVFQGMFELRNVIEAGTLGVILGYLLWTVLNIEIKYKIIVIGVVIVPIAALALIGFQGDCLTKFVKKVFLFVRNRRKLRYRRIKKNAEKASTGKTPKATNKKAKSKTKNSRSR